MTEFSAPWLRFFRSELRIVFGRRRNQALLAVVAVFPVVIGIALRAADRPGQTGGPSVAFINQLAGNGFFLAVIALTLLLTLVLPLAMAVIAGDSVAGEAGYGTLRALLIIPAGRARLLTVKYAAIVTFGLVATFLVTGVALATGAALFPLGPVTLLSGSTVPLASGILRLLLVALYVTAALAALGAIGLALSSLTEHPVGAIAALAVLTVASEAADSLPQFGGSTRTCPRTGGPRSTRCSGCPSTPAPCCTACCRSGCTCCCPGRWPGPGCAPPTSRAEALLGLAELGDGHPSMPRPIAATMVSDSQIGTGQPSQVMLGDRCAVNSGLMLRCANTACRIGPTTSFCLLPCLTCP